MNLSSSMWPSEQEMENLILADEYQVCSEFMTATFVNEDLHHIFTSKNDFSSFLTLEDNSGTSCVSRKLERPLKQLKLNHSHSITPTMLYHDSLPLSLTPTFSNMDPSSLHHPNGKSLGAKNQDCNAGHFPFTNEDRTIIGQGTKRRASNIAKSATQLRDHVIAERKRRENLNQLFMALSAILPSLKKMDKSSVLEEAVKYIKQLQEEEKKLEVQSGETAAESVVIMKKAESFEVGDEDVISGDTMEDSVLKIEAKMSGKNVLLRIHCQKQKGALEKVLTQIEKLNFIVINSSALPFGNSNLDITIIAQMEKECSLAVKDLVRGLCSAFQPLIK